VRPGKRRDVFVACLRDGATVAEANEHAQVMPGRAERDADIFIGLFTGFIALRPPV
jgi:hypothetical protein